MAFRKLNQVRAYIICKQHSLLCILFLTPDVKITQVIFTLLIELLAVHLI